MLDGQLKHLDEDPEDFIGEQLPDPWTENGSWDEKPTTAESKMDLSALKED